MENLFDSSTGTKLLPEDYKEKHSAVCYLVVKRVDPEGCIALKTEHGKQLVELKRELGAKVGYEKVQLITISRPSAYGEYEPYHFVDSKEALFEAIEVASLLETKQETEMTPPQAERNSCATVRSRKTYDLHL